MPIRPVTASAQLIVLSGKTVTASARLVLGRTVAASAELVTGNPHQIETSAVLLAETVVTPTILPIPVFDEPPIIITGGVGAILYKDADEQLKWLEIPVDWATKRYVLTIAGGVPAWGQTNDASEVFGGWGNSWGTSWGF